MLLADFTKTPHAALLDRINSLPGPPCASTGAMEVKYYTLKRQGRVPPAPAPAAPAATAEDEDTAAARAMILAGKGAKDLEEEFGWTLTAAQRFAAEVRAAQIRAEEAA